MALISAARYGGPQESIVEDPGEAPVQTAQGTILTDEPGYEPQPYVPTAADVAPDPQRNITEEQNWMKDLQEYAKKYPEGPQRDTFIGMTMRNMRNSIAAVKNSNNLILQQDREALDKVLYDTSKFEGRGPRNDQEATQINPAWPAMSQLALDHSKNEIQKRIDAAFKHNSTVDVPPTAARTARYDQASALIDRAMRGYAGVDKYEVLRQVNPAALDLTKFQTKDLHDKLIQLNKQRNIDNTMNTYIGWAQPMLNRAHILATNDDKMLQFEGALSRELKNLKSTSKDPEAPLTREEVYQVTSQLLQKEQYSRGPFGGSTVFEFEVPKGYMTPERISKFQTKFGHLPTPQDIYDLYSAHKAMVQTGEQAPEETDPRYVTESYKTKQK
jgi:hypothetical protein